jgi:hypothetical protein
VGEITTFCPEMFFFLFGSPSENQLIKPLIFPVCEEASSGNREVAILIWARGRVKSTAPSNPRFVEIAAV